MMRRSKVQWDELIAEYESSGMSVAEWCEAHGIQRSTFEKHYKLVVELRQSTRVQWMAVEQGPPEKAYNPIQIEIGRCRVSVPEGFNPDHLAKICNVLVAI